MAQTGPLFVVGAPRSGTTLLMEILKRHPALWICEETYFLHFVYGRRERLGDLADPAVREHVVDAYLKTNRMKQQGVDLAPVRAALLEEAVDYEAFFLALMRACAAQMGRSRFGEKTPDHARQADLLIDRFPDCALIHIVRDPRDVVASMRRMPWGDRSIFSNTRQWLDCQHGALKVKDRPQYFRLDFEELVADPAGQMARICKFIGEDFSPAMLEARDGDEEGANRWWLGRARGSIDKTRAMRWKKELGPSRAALVEWLARDTMKELGYEPCSGTATPTLLARARAAEMLDRARWTLKRLPGSWIYRTRPDDLAAEEATMDALA